MDTISIRNAVEKDILAIVQFNAAMAFETEAKKLDLDILSQGVNGILKYSDKGAYYLAESNHRIVGQLMITYEWSDWRNGTFWWIQSVYVLPEFRGKGIYKKLYQKVLNMAKADNSVCGIRLYVDKNNSHAKKIYEQCGMKQAHYDMYEVDFVLG